MDTREAGRKGGKSSGDTRLVKGREAVLACKTKRDLLAVVMQLEQKAFMRGYVSGRRKGIAEALGEADAQHATPGTRRADLGQSVRLA
jgi:hypothetical protein